jgi:malate synthase
MMLDQLMQEFHNEFTATGRMQALVRPLRRDAHKLGPAKAPAVAVQETWSCHLPEWCRDQRNQMTGPANDIDLIRKLMASGSPGVMIDLEDAMVNTPEAVNLGIRNIVEVIQQPHKPVVFIRVRGLHLTDTYVTAAGKSLVMPAPLYDIVSIIAAITPAKLSHPLCFYIPKSESAEEALWWRDVFRHVEYTIGKPTGWIKCMALVEAYPMAYQMDEFIYNLRDHIVGLNMGRWDYMASIIHWHLNDPEWILPDRDTIPHDVEFFQNVRVQLVRTCHKRGILAIGGMTARFPDRKDAGTNATALQALQADKQNEASLCFDGAWTGHPDQNAIAVAAFPEPNQVHLLPRQDRELLHFNVPPKGPITVQGTRRAIETAIKYRMAVIQGKGATMIDGYMEDLATDRIYRLMVAQRLKHYNVLPNEYVTASHRSRNVIRMFDDIANSMIDATDAWDDHKTVALIKRAAFETLQSILEERFTPNE